MAFTLKRTPSVSSTKQHKQISAETLKIRKSHNELRSRPERNTIKTVEAPEMMSRSGDSNFQMRSLSQLKQRNRESNFPNHTQNSQSQKIPCEESSHPLENFKIITLNILKKRNLSILLSKLGDVVASNIIGQSMYALQLVFLLYKKSLIEIMILAKFLSEGSKNYIPDVTETNRLRFTKTEGYFLLTKIVIQQLKYQRKILLSIFSLIKKQCPSFLSLKVQGLSLVSPPKELKHCSTQTLALSEFESALNSEGLSNEFFIKTIRKYLDVFISDLLLINKEVQNAKQSLIFLNILYEIYMCGSFENFVEQFFPIDSETDEKKSQQAEKLPTYMAFLNKSFKFILLNKMNIQEFTQKLVNSLHIS